MMMPAVGMVVMVAVAAVRATLRLEGDLHLHEIRSETAEHILDHMVGANAKNVVSNFRRQMPISQVPSEPHKLMRIFVPDFDDGLHGGMDLQPPSVGQLQAISIRHRDSFRQVEKDIFTLICSQANAAAMACVKIESERACRFFLRPMSSGTMNGSALHCHPQYRK
jgi:hypothetical protein